MTIETYSARLKPFEREINDARLQASRARTFARLIQLGTIIGALAVWELTVVAMGVNPIILPRVSVIAQSLWTLTADGTIPWHTLVTLGRVFFGFVAACVLGVKYWADDESLHGRAQYCRSADRRPLSSPENCAHSSATYLVWLGETYKFAIVLMTAFFPIVISTFQGLRQVDAGLVSAASDLGASDWRIQSEVMLPAAMPAILSGMRLGMGVAIVLTIAAEMIASQSGLGYLVGRVWCDY